jgi:hypothetical protein
MPLAPFMNRQRPHTRAPLAQCTDFQAAVLTSGKLCRKIDDLPHRANAPAMRGLAVTVAAGSKGAQVQSG